jgi:hypothetical protein
VRAGVGGDLQRPTNNVKSPASVIVVDKRATKLLSIQNEIEEKVSLPLWPPQLFAPIIPAAGTASIIW